jgi:hypothetical protein
MQHSFAELVVAGTPVVVLSGLLVLAMMVECIGIIIATIASGPCAGGIAEEVLL